MVQNSPTGQHVTAQDEVPGNWFKNRISPERVKSDNIQMPYPLGIFPARTGAHRNHRRFTLSLCSLSPLRLILSRLSRSLTTEGSEDYFLLMAIVGVPVSRMSGRNAAIVGVGNLRYVEHPC